MSWQKFNNPNGTNEQKICDNHCSDLGFNDPAITPSGIYDSGTGNSERKDRDGNEFNVEYDITEGKLCLNKYADKCIGCPHWNKFKQEQEGQ